MGKYQMSFFTEVDIDGLNFHFPLFMDYNAFYCGDSPAPSCNAFDSGRSMLDGQANPPLCLLHRQKTMRSGKEIESRGFSQPYLQYISLLESFSAITSSSLYQLMAFLFPLNGRKVLETKLIPSFPLLLFFLISKFVVVKSRPIELVECEIRRGKDLLSCTRTPIEWPSKAHTLVVQTPSYFHKRRGASSRSPWRKIKDFI